jgi:hypothetical protein
MTYYVLFFIPLEKRRVCLAGITPHPDQQWMEQQARNVTMKDSGFLAHSRYLLHDRDGKFCSGFREVIKAGKVRPLKLPARSPNLNAFAERWVRSVKEECLSRLILIGENSLRRALTQYIEHYHRERNHQGKANELYSPYHQDLLGVDRKEQSGAGNDWAAYSSTTSVEHRNYRGRTNILTMRDLSNKGHSSLSAQYSCVFVGCHLRRKVFKFAVSRDPHKPTIHRMASASVHAEVRAAVSSPCLAEVAGRL